MQTLTPDRHITVTIDGPESIPVELFFAKARTRFQIRDPELSNVEQLASGVWILKPEATSLHALHETTAGQTKALRLTSFNASADVTEIPMQRKLTELTGVGAGPNVSAFGDYFMLRRPPAGDSWNQGLTSARPALPLPTTPNYPLDTVLVKKNGLDVADQGYVLRWIQPAHPQEFVDYPAAFRFGGPLTVDGYGEFGLCFGGDGQALLYEWIGGAWVMVDQFRYAPAKLVPNHAHTCRIIPHCGKWIEFRGEVTSGQENTLYSPGEVPYTLSHDYGSSLQEYSHLYEARNRADLPPRGGGVGYTMTGAGVPEFQVRRDVVVRLQPAHVTYPASGTLTDSVITIPQVDTSSHVAAVRTFSIVLYDGLTLQPHGAVTAALLNAATGIQLSPGAEAWSFNGQTYTINGFVIAGYPNAVKCRLTLTNNDGAGGPYSPWLLGYEVRKLGENGTPPHTPLVIDGTHYRQSPVTRISITGPNSDPSHETANLRIADLVARCGRLATRGEGNIEVKTTYNPADETKTAILLDGYFIKSEGRIRGYSHGGDRWPASAWRDYELTCLGKWKRLHERNYLGTDVLSLAVDIDPATPPDKGQAQPAKVTDAIRLLLVQGAGVPETQLDIPDLDIRLWPNLLDGQEALKPLPGVNADEFARRLARDYLNYFLVWDRNAGASGLWRLKPVPSGSEASVWTFVLGGPASGRLASYLPSYGVDTSFVSRRTLSEWTIPPEGNWLRVSGLVGRTVFSCTARNPKSWNRPGESTADPNHPDYLGRFRPIYRRIDGTLTTKAAVMVVTRRVFDVACRAQRMVRFETPLPLINAAAIEPSIYTAHERRPLMFGDVVTFNGAKAMVRQCVMNIRKEHHQLATVELVRFNDPLPA